MSFCRWEAVLLVLMCLTVILPKRIHAADTAENTEGGTVMRLWQGDAPGSDGSKSAENITKEGHVNNVTVPTVTVYLPKEKANGAAVVICPGGGYGILAINHEGHDLARWLNTQGIAGIVLKYRLPKGHTHDVPLMDAQRALRFTRAHAAEWKLDVKKVGIMGFSAGGHLAATATTHFDKPAGTPKDDIDKLDCRPDFAALIYPVISFKAEVGHTGSKNNLIGKDAPQEMVDLYSNELHVTPQTPPTFLLSTSDDGVKVENSLVFYAACRKHKVPVEMHVYGSGGHGYGIRATGKNVATWHIRFADWLREMKFIPKE